MPLKKLLMFIPVVLIISAITLGMFSIITTDNIEDVTLIKEERAAWSMSTPTPTPTPLPTPTPRPIVYTSEEAQILVEVYEHQLLVDDNTLCELSQYSNIEDYREDVRQDREEAISNLEYYNQMYEELIVEEAEAIWTARYEEYPEATTIWLFLTTEMELSDHCAAGILGNMMTEAGGNSLHINPSAYNAAGYYGICQWNTTSYWDVNGANLVTQLNYLMTTIEYEYASCGDRSYESFCELENEQAAALSFARSYERCAPYYTSRERNATTALNYFTS